MSERLRIVVTDHTFASLDGERSLADRWSADLFVADVRTEEQAIDAAAGANALLVTFAPVTRAVLNRLAPDAVVVRYGVGVDNVDLEAARELGIRVCNVPDYGTDEVADHTVACILALTRRLVEYTDAIRDQGWIAPVTLGVVDASQDTVVGLIGTGRIGLAVARRVQAFGMRVVADDPFVSGPKLRDLGIEPLDRESLLAVSDVVSLHVPLTLQTHHLLDADSIRVMKPTARVVNTARGGLIDEIALVAALEEGRLGGAALDVYELEPLPTDSTLRRAPRLILTPHAAFYSDASMRRLQASACDEVDRAFEGRSLRSQVV